METTNDPATSNSGARTATDPSTESTKFRVAICGAGIAGLALAALLSKQGNIAVDIYECNDHIRVKGARVAVWKRFWHTLHHELDFDRTCVNLHATEPGGWSSVRPPLAYEADLGIMYGVNMPVLSRGYKSYTRQGVLSALLSKLDPKTCKVYRRHRLQHYAALGSGGMKLVFASNKLASCDMLVGADGVHSVVRQRLYQDAPELAESRFSGQYAYRMSFSAEALKEKDSNHLALKGFPIWIGKGRHLITAPEGPKIHLTVYENVPLTPEPPRDKDVHVATQEKIVSLIEKWDKHILSLVKSPPLPDDEGNLATRWSIYTAPLIPSFVAGPIALIGDAAHAMLPHQSLGTCQGFEDAFVLAQLLGHPLTTKSTLDYAIKTYDIVRRLLAQNTARLSEVVGKLFDRKLEPQSNQEYQDMQRDMITLCDWLHAVGGCEGIANKAVKIIEAFFEQQREAEK